MIRRTYGNTQRIGGVIRPGYFRQTQDDTHHLLHLLLVGGRYPSHPLLDGVGPEFRHGQPTLGKDGEHHPPRLGYGNRAGDVSSEVKYLDRGFRGLVDIQNRTKRFHDTEKTLRLGAAGLRFDVTVADM